VTAPAASLLPHAYTDTPAMSTPPESVNDSVDVDQAPATAGSWEEDADTRSTSNSGESNQLDPFFEMTLCLEELSFRAMFQ